MRLIPIPPGEITEGKVLLKGNDVLQYTEKQMQDVRGNEISMIFQEPMTALNPVYTVGTQIMEAERKKTITAMRRLLMVSVKKPTRLKK